MAFLGYSEDFELDDDGILRDSADSGGILIDDDGIVRDDFDLLSKHGSSTHWTDSGLGGDKQSSTPSTLRQLDLQSYPSFEDVSHRLDESNVNISDLEASKDDLSFDGDYENDREFYGDHDTLHKGNNRSGLSSRSSFNNSLNFEEPFNTERKEAEDNQDLFGDEYYRQLQELGVLVDENDFVNPKDSLQEFETFEEHYSRDFDEERDKGFEDFLREGGQTPTRDSFDVGLAETGAGNKRTYGETKEFDVVDHLDHSDRFDQSDNEFNKSRTRPNTASSTRTISSRSFPEISPEEALELYTERVQLIDNDASSIDFDQSQKTVGDDDEIYFVASHMSDGDSPKPAKIPAYDNENVPSMTPKSREARRGRAPTPHNKDDSLDRSGSLTPQAANQGGYQSPEDKIDSLTQVTRLESRGQRKSEGDIFRPDSSLSDRSAASETASARPKIKQTPSKQKLPHAKSQESFFDMVEEESPKRAEKGPKRLLPKPGSGEVNQSFKVKSKSTTNIAAMGPVKPTHMSLVEIQHIVDNPEFDIHEHSEPKSVGSDVPKGELTKKLKQESSKRQQATQLVQQLQADYDKLLSKYALAELTIDQLRLGAKITLHANSPTPSQATSGSIQSAQQLHLLQLSAAQKGVASASPLQAQNVFFPENQGQDGSTSGMLQNRGSSPGQLPRSDSTNSMDSTSTPRGEVEQPGGLTVADGAEKVKMGLLFQAKNLDERMESFQTLLGEKQLNIEEQETVFDKIRSDHEKLRRDYLQSKEDYNVLKRSSAAGADVNFDQEKELEGELFKIGMKFDEIHEKVDENMKEKSSARQPFQTSRAANQETSEESGQDPSTENMKKRIRGTKAGNDLLEPRTDSEFDKKLKHLHEEYNALMDRYRRLKQMARSPERDKEIDNLVKKLTKIADEEPDIFKLPPDVENRSLELKKEERKVSAEKQPMENASASVRPKSATKSRPKGSEHRLLPTQPAKSYEILTASETWSLAESMDRWEKSKQTAAEPQNRSHRSESPGALTPGRHSHNTSLASSHSSVFEDGYGADRSADAGTLGNEEPDTGIQSRRSNSYSSLSSRGRHSPSSRDPYQDRNSPIPSLPRPRRHDFPDRERRDRKDTLKKTLELLTESTSSLATDSGIASIGATAFKPLRPEEGSTTSLQDSGISEHEGGATGTSNSPLSKLPGPGKFKQMTGRREHDTDSGFIGSMVGSEVSAGNLSARRQPPQSPLRLRHPADAPANQRPSSRQSSQSEGSPRARTPTSVASSKSSRRSHGTPTKAFPLKETKTKEPDTSTERPMTKPKAPVKSRSRDQNTQLSRDYTDDSYTTVTESEMSFDSEARPKKLKSGSRSGSLRQIDKIEEDSEEEQFSVDPSLNETTDLNLSWITDTERPSLQSVRTNESKRGAKQQNLKSSAKSKITEQPKVPGKRGRQIIDDDITPTASPTRDTTKDTTQDTYTSDETTPRSVIERERKKSTQKTASAPARQTPTKTSASPRQEMTVEAPRQAQMQQDRRLEVQQQDRQVLERIPFSQREAIKEYKEIAVGSGSDETILASDAETAATRGSVNSQRLKQLSDELGKLREEFVKANQEKQQQPPPAPLPVQPPPPQNQYYDQYFDPTEDPLAFMRGPRRRANSFSGHGGRDWDYDWTLPNVQRDGDIPLGYAAADSYASPRRRQVAEEQSADPAQSRGRHRLRHRIKQRNAGTQHISEQNGYDSDQSPVRAEEPAHQRVQGHYGYYSPRPVQSETNIPVQQTELQTGSPQLPQGRRVYGSQPNLAFFGYQPPPPPPRSTVSGSTRSSARQHSPLRQTLYSYAASGPQRQSLNLRNQRPYANDDIHVNDGQRLFVPQGASEVLSDGGVDPNQAVYTSRCPICGSESYHTHGEYVYPPPEDRPIGYLVPQHGRTMYVPVYAMPRTHPRVYPRASRPVPKLKPHLLPLYNMKLRPRYNLGRQARSRSKSASRVRHYSPDGKIPSKYFVRQFGGESSESAESDVEPQQRSRSTGRQRRMRRGRKYRRAREDGYYSERGATGLPSSQLEETTTVVTEDRRVPAAPTTLTGSPAVSPAAEADLETSLHLVGEIDELTKKMMDTVGGELAQYRKRKDYGSSVW